MNIRYYLSDSASPNWLRGEAILLPAEEGGDAREEEEEETQGEAAAQGKRYP